MGRGFDEMYRLVLGQRQQLRDLVQWLLQDEFHQLRRLGHLQQVGLHSHLLGDERVRPTCARRPLITDTSSEAADNGLGK